jgi:hypothetical protein
MHGTPMQISDEVAVDDWSMYELIEIEIADSVSLGPAGRTCASRPDDLFLS